MPGHLESFVALHTTLAELAEAQQRLDGIPEWMRELHEEHSERAAAIDAVAAEGAAADQERREAEAALEDAQADLKRYQQQLGKVSTQREYGAMLTEIDTTKARVAESENKALSAAERKEQSDARIVELRDDFRDLDGRYKAELAKWESEKPSVVATIDMLTRRCDELRAGVPRNALVLFDRLHEHLGGAALAKVKKTELARGNTMWHCEACSYNVRPQVLVEIRNHGALSQCDSCKRILYWDDAE